MLRTRRGLIAAAGALLGSQALAQGVPGLTPFFAGRRPLGTTFNPSDKNASVTLSNGNLTMATSGSNVAARSILSKSAGKWYFDATAGSGSSATGVGVGNSSASLATLPGADSAGPNGVGYYSSNGYAFKGNVSQGTGATWGAGDVIGVAVDFTAGTVAFYKNNVLQVTVSGLPSGALFIMCSVSSPELLTLNATPVYDPPGGFSVWA